MKVRLTGSGQCPAETPKPKVHLEGFLAFPFLTAAFALGCALGCALGAWLLSDFS